MQTGSRARAPWMLSSVAGPAARSGVAPVVDSTLQCARPMQNSHTVRVQCGEARPIRKRHVLGSAAQGSAGLCCGGAARRRRREQDERFVPWAMGSKRAHRWTVALAHAADAHLRAPAGEALHAYSDAAIERHRAVAGTLPGDAEAARAQRERYRRCSGTAGGAAATTAQCCAGSKQWCNVGTPSTPVRVLPSGCSECSTCVREYSFCRAPPGRARRGCASRHGRVRRHRVPRRRACRGRRLQRTTL
jgi:hypothetical protein